MHLCETQDTGDPASRIHLLKTNRRFRYGDQDRIEFYRYYSVRPDGHGHLECKIRQENRHGGAKDLPVCTLLEFLRNFRADHEGYRANLSRGLQSTRRDLYKSPALRMRNW